MCFYFSVNSPCFCAFHSLLLSSKYTFEIDKRLFSYTYVCQGLTLIYVCIWNTFAYENKNYVYSHMRTSKIQTSLRIREDWLGSSLFAVHIPQDLKSEGIEHSDARTI